MKKLLVAIFAVLYMGTSIGATVQMHYCMGTLADWGVGHNDSKTCEKCGMEKEPGKDNGCCRDEHKFFKDNTDQQSAQAGLQILPLPVTALPSFHITILPDYFPGVTWENPMSHAPPPGAAVAVYIRNCVFRI